jgi:Flp pilus assembly protein TadG
MIASPNRVNANRTSSREKLPCRLRLSTGQVAVEFAAVALVFFFLIFLVMDYGRVFFVQENVHQAVQAGARYASIGNHEAGTDPKTGKSYTRPKSISDYVQQNASAARAMGAIISNFQVSSANGGAGSAGGPQDIETISLTVNLPLWTPLVANLFPNGQYSFTANATIKNEPFPPNQTN